MTCVQSFLLKVYDIPCCLSDLKRKIRAVVGVSPRSSSACKLQGQSAKVIRQCTTGWEERLTVVVGPSQACMGLAWGLTSAGVQPCLESRVLAASFTFIVNYRATLFRQHEQTERRLAPWVLL